MHTRVVSPSNAAIVLTVPKLHTSIDSLTPGSACPGTSRLEYVHGDLALDLAIS